MKIANFFTFSLLCLGFAFAGGTAASALEQKTFDTQSFKTAQEAGQSLLVHVSAPWCGGCKAQHAVIDELAKKPEFAAVTVFQVDFDSQSDVVKSFMANVQTTLIAFKGTSETGRLVGQTKVKPIEDLIGTTLAK